MEKKSIEQQLKASSQQLEANEQQLRVTNQQLVEESNRLRKSEEKLTKQHRFVSTLMSNLPGIAYSCLNDKKYTMKFMSNGTYALTGYYPEEMMGEKAIKFYNDIIHPDDQKLVWDSLQKQIKTKGQFQFTYRLITKSGKIKWVWEQGTAVYDIDGNLEAIEGFITDISEKKEAEEELKSAYQQIRASNQQLEANEQQLRATNQQLIASETELRAQLEKSEEQRKTNLKILNDLTIATNKLKIEINQRKRIEKDLIKSEARLRSYLDGAPDGIFIADENGKYLEVNPAACVITGYSVEELLQKNISDLLQENDLEKGIMHFKEVQEKGFANGEIGFVTKSGENRFWQVAAVKLSNTRFLGFAKDITARKKVEIALEENEAKLKNIIENSTNLYYTHSPEGEMTFISPQVKEVLGYEPDEVKRNWTDFITDNPFNKKAIEFTQKAIQTGERQPLYELEMINKNGNKIIVEVRESPVVKNGKVTSIVGSLADITARKQAEDELSLSEQRFRRVYENMKIGIAFVSLDFKIQHANKSYCKMLGYEESELIGKHLKDITQKDFIQENLKKQQQLGAGKIEHFQMEKVFIHKDGHEVFGILDANLIRGVNNEPFYFIGSVIDITARKRAEEKLKKSRRELNELIIHSPVCIKKIDLDFNLQFMSDPGVKQLKIDNVNDFYGKSYPLSFFPKKFKNEMFIKLQEAKKTGEALDLEGQLADTKGNRLWFHNIISPVKDEEGILEYILIVSMDITERKEAENKVKDADRRFRALIENAPGGIAINDENGLIQYVSPSVLKMFGYSWDELTAKNAGVKFTHPEDLKIVLDTFSKIQQNPDLIPTIEYRFKKKNGGYCWIETTFTNLLHDSTIKGFVLNFRDITERKASEEELIKMEKLSSIGTLAGGIAHDFNNILAVIYGNISFLKMDLTENHENYEILAEIESSISRAKKLSNQLLTFSKGGSPVKKEVNITELIKDTILFDLSGSHLKPVFNFTDTEYYAEVDEGQVQQVFSNLTINAIQASSDGSHLYVSLNRCFVDINEVINLKSGRYLKITFKDKGKGISNENLGRIFDPYFTTKERGNGLGLATVYSIIKKHGGVINVESEVGKGTTFTIYLPESEKNRNKLDKTINKADSKTIKPQQIKRILIMDDEEPIRKFLSRVFSKLGYDYDTAFNGEEVITKYKESLEQNNPFDLIIMDLTIPGGMGGKEALKNVLSIDKNAKVIVSSGYSSESSIAEYKALGFLDVLEKPFTITKLEEILDKIFI